MSADSAEEVCGETWDHTLELVDERDGIRQYLCCECGAEIIEDDEEATR